MRDNYGRIITVIKGMKARVFGMSLVVFSGAICIASFRLKLLANAQEKTRLGFSEAVSLSFIGYFFNNFLPTSIGGDFAKAYYLARKTPNKTASFTAVFVDRVIGLFTMVFMAFTALLFVQDRVLDRNVKLLICGITAAAALAVVFMMNKAFARKFSVLLAFVRRFEDKLKNLYNAINRYRHSTVLLAKSVGISVVSQLLFFMSIWLIASSIGSYVSVVNILLLMPIVSMLSLLPSINGLGLREGSMVFLFGPIIGKENAFAVSILWLFALLIISLVGGAIYAMSPQFKIPVKELKGQ